MLVLCDVIDVLLSTDSKCGRVDQMALRQSRLCNSARSAGIIFLCSECERKSLNCTFCCIRRAPPTVPPSCGKKRVKFGKCLEGEDQAVASLVPR